MNARRGTLCGLGIVAAVVVLSSCGDGSGPSGTGLADLELRVPSGVTDGIALVVVTGGTVRTVQSAGPQFRAFGEDTPTAQIVARGAFTGTAAKLATICVDELQNLSDFQVAVVQVAGGQGAGYAVRDIAGYTARLANPRTAASCP